MIRLKPGDEMLKLYRFVVFGLALSCQTVFSQTAHETLLIQFEPNKDLAIQEHSFYHMEDMQDSDTLAHSGVFETTLLPLAYPVYLRIELKRDVLTSEYLQTRQNVRDRNMQILKNNKSELFTQTPDTQVLNNAIWTSSYFYLYNFTYNSIYHDYITKISVELVEDDQTSTQIIQYYDPSVVHSILSNSLQYDQECLKKFDLPSKSILIGSDKTAKVEFKEHSRPYCQMK